MLKTFIHKALIPGLQKECLINEDFEESLTLLCDKALELGLKLSLNSSYRPDLNVKGAIVEPAKMGNHLVGHAIDCNIWEGNKFWASKDLKTPIGNVAKLIDYYKSIGGRWGGDFHNVDVVHFDDGLNLKDPDKWHKIYNELYDVKA